MGPAPTHCRYELRGGARLLTAELPARASASLVLMLGVGSRFEEDRIGGVSHFVEHLFFKGTKRRPTAKEIAESIEGVGGSMNASTDKEVTVYWTRVPADGDPRRAEDVHGPATGLCTQPVRGHHVAQAPPGKGHHRHDGVGVEHHARRHPVLCPRALPLTQSRDRRGGR